MHTTSMFAQRQPLQQQVELYDLQAIAPQFASWNFQIGPPYDQHTPNIALMTIDNIQRHAAQGHPIRVGAFNILSEGAFNNASFQDLVYTIIMRVGFGIEAGEWRNLEMAVNTTIERAVKACSSFMAASDPDFMNTLAPRDQPAVRENAEVWNYLVALAQRQVQYVPFSQMGGTGLSGVAGSTQEAMAAARNLRGTTAGAFVDAQPDYGVTATRYNNNASPATGRYGRRAEAMFGKLEGSMQEALQQSGAVNQQGQPQGAANVNYQGRMRRPNPTGAAPAPEAASNTQASAAVQQFDTEVTDFTRPMATTTTAAKEEPPQKSMFTVQIGDEVVQIARELKDGAAQWKPSKLQRFLPAWCKRTHVIRYFESKDGVVIAMLQELTNEQKEIAMNYDAHAIDPSKGQPEPEVPVKPVREEAKVLYTPADSVTVNLVSAKKVSMEEDVNGAIRSTRLAAEMSGDVPDAYVKGAIVNSPLVYQSADNAKEDLILLRAIGGAKDFAEAAEYVPKISNDLARKVVNQALVDAINRVTVCEIGVGMRISDFVEDGPAIIEALEGNFGALISEKMKAHQTQLLSANVIVVPAAEMKSYADATLTTEDQDELSVEMLERVLFLQRNVCAVWVNFTDDELALSVPDKGAATIQQESLGTVYKIAQTAFEEAESLHFSEQYLVTKDNVRYRLHRGLLNRDCFLLSKEGVK